MNFPRSLSRWLRPLALVLSLLAGAGGAAAESPDATDDAFGALLAMPGAQPKDGGWIVPREAAKDEDDLIAQLRDARKAGADFNAMRHGGTLLAHALRAGKDRTALWLLRNGADPRKVLEKGRANADDLARKYGRTAVVAVLEGRDGLKPTPPVLAPARTPARTPAPVAASAPPPTRVQQSVALMAGLTSPGRPYTPESRAQAAQEWARWAATLSQEEYRALFADGGQFDPLVRLAGETDGGLDAALARLPLEDVRRHAQAIADALAHWSFAQYAVQTPRIGFTGAARSWPALWRRIDQPLDYDRQLDLAARIPPALWPGLRASGYPERDAEVTGCLLATVDLPGMQALWADFQRAFSHAREAAPGLVLARWRLGRDRYPCDGGSDAAETTAKLAFLRAQGVTGPVVGVQVDPDDPMTPALAAMVETFEPAQAPAPRLKSVPPDCRFARDDRWLDALIKARSVGWGVTPSDVQLLAVPGSIGCGLLVSGDTTTHYPDVSDDFDDGPFRDPPGPRCGDISDDGEAWTLGSDGVHPLPQAVGARGTGFRLRLVRDVLTGKSYLLDSGVTGASCNAYYGLPNAFEWRVQGGQPLLVDSPDAGLVDRLLRQQCKSTERTALLACEGPIQGDETLPDDGSPLDWLREGHPVSLHLLVDELGAERRAAYRAALAAHDNARLRRLVASGIPAWWTADEIQALAKAELPLEEKRRRIALLFADADQLSAALLDPWQQVANTLGPWLPRQDWGPILRLVRKEPMAWYDARRRFEPADAQVGCSLDRAQGFLCEGGLNP